MTEHFITLSTTEPNNNIGIVKLRHADVNSQTIVAQIVENGQPKNFEGLQPFFCLMAQEVTGQGVSEELVKTFNAYKGTLEYMTSDNALQMVGRNEAYFSFRKQSGDTWIEQFSTRSFHYIVEKSIYSQPFKDSNYWWTFKELYEKFISYQEIGRQTWQDFIEENREILKSIDPGGELITKFFDRETQVIGLGNFFRKLRNTTNPITVACLGDSLTYGHDMNSTDRRPPDTNPTDSGAVHIMDRASKTYPEKLQELFDEVFSHRVTVKNMGYSGDRTDTSYEHWNASGADLVLIMLGTNDIGKGDISSYTKFYRKIITREQSNGTSVVIMLPSKRANLADPLLAVYRTVALQLAKEQNIPVIDMARELSNVPVSLYSDGTHFNGLGYSYMASRIFASLLGESLAHSVKVSHSFLSVRNQLDGIIPISGTSLSETKNLLPTPDEISPGVGLTMIYSSGGKSIYAFETKEDNIVVMPELYCNNAFNLELQLDFGLKGQALSNSQMIDFDNTGYQPSPIIEFTEKDLNYARIKSYHYKTKDVININGISSIKDKMIIIPKAGFHTIKITNKGGNNVSLYGLNFVPFEALRGIIFGNTPNVYSFKTHVNFTDVGEVPISKINVKDLITSLRKDFAYANYYDTVPIKITVRNHDKNIIIYYVMLNGINQNKIDTVLKNKATNVSGDEYVLGQYSGTTHRILKNVYWEYDSAVMKNSDEANLVLEWGGNLGQPSLITIQVA